MNKKTNKKIIHWIRHAEAESNVPDYNFNSIDSNLTINGMAQCAKLKKNLKNKLGLSKIQLYVVSPLERTLSTYTNVFETMSTTVSTTVSTNTTRLNHVISLEEIRERIDKPCHKRQDINFKKLQYKFINFAEIKTNRDYLYEFVGGFETEIELIERAKKFLNWLSLRNETNIIVITHGSFLHILFNKIIPNNPIDFTDIKFYTKFNSHEKKYVGEFFNNCEIKTTEIFFTSIEICSN